MASVVTGIAMNALPAADTLDGTEIVPGMQGGAAVQMTTQDIANLTPSTATTVTGSGGVDSTLSAPMTYDVSLSDMDDATVKGRASGAGTGAPQDLTEQELGDLVWEDFSLSFARRNPNNNNVGYINVPPFSTANRALANNDCGQGIVVATAAARTYTIPNDATDPDIASGFTVTLAVTNAGGSCAIALGAGVTLLDLRDGSTGAMTITGVGVATLWKTAANFWTVNGSANLA